MSSVTKLDLIPTYSYARIYKHGDVLHRHKDRPSCEISATLNLGGDEWPLFLDPTGEIGNEGVQVNLKPGDALIYKGTIVEHWREPFAGYECGQVFFHYNDKNGPFKESNIYDGRQFIGVPKWKTRL
jgi:alkylated DNA repair dioxygenase AlkB